MAHQSARAFLMGRVLGAGRQPSAEVWIHVWEEQSEYLCLFPAHHECQWALAFL